MLDDHDMPCHAPYKFSYVLENIETFSYFTKIMTGKPEIGDLTLMTELYPFLESKTLSSYFMVQ